jgi:hypothetical protein
MISLDASYRRHLSADNSKDFATTKVEDVEIQTFQGKRYKPKEV